MLSLVEMSRGYSSLECIELLTVVASLLGAQALGEQASVEACDFEIACSVVAVHGLSCSTA